MIRWGRFAGAYALVGGVALALIWPRGAPLMHPERRLLLDAASAHWLSLGIGLLFGAVLVLASRMTVQRFEWARRLHLELRPLARGLPPTGIVVFARSRSMRVTVPSSRLAIHTEPAPAATASGLCPTRY